MTTVILQFDLKFRSKKVNKDKFWHSKFWIKNIFLIQFCLRIPMMYLALVYIYKSKKCDIRFWRNAIPQLLQSLGGGGANIDISVWNLWLKMTGNLTYSSFLFLKSGFYNNLPIFWKFWAKITKFWKPWKPSFIRLYFHSFDKFWCDSVKYWMVCDLTSGHFWMKIAWHESLKRNFIE